MGSDSLSGESYEHLDARVIPALLGLAEIHPNERVVAVTHGGPMAGPPSPMSTP